MNDQNITTGGSTGSGGQASTADGTSSITTGQTGINGYVEQTFIDEVIEEFDGDGKLLKRTTKYKKSYQQVPSYPPYPIYPNPIWYGLTQPYCISGTVQMNNCTTTTATEVKATNTI